MLFNPELQAQLAKDRIDREIKTAQLLRRVRKPSSSFRQAIGLRFIRIGARLAGEPSRELVRFR